jgi:hypothetical protein
MLEIDKPASQHYLLPWTPLPRGRQHPLRPHRTLHARPLARRAGLPSRTSRLRHSRSQPLGLARCVLHESTFLPPFAPPGITPGSRIPNNATLAGSWCSLLAAWFPGGATISPP